jgi:ketosteroid isomerase-like protein
MDLDAVNEWIDAYEEAWRSNDPQRIAGLFTEDATYAYDPWGNPLRGREAIVADWLREPDEPDSWEAEYRPMLIHDDRAIVTGVTRYADGKVYSNLFVIDFDDEGRCRVFTEWYMRHPHEKEANP